MFFQQDLLYGTQSLSEVLLMSLERRGGLHTPRGYNVTMMRFQLLVFLLLVAVCTAALFVHHVDRKKHEHRRQSSQLRYNAVTPLSELQRTSYGSILKEIPESAQIVLIGEGTHGTEEFFRIRSELTKHLIENYGFDAVICEGDVQPFYQLSKISSRDNIRQSLSDIFDHHFPDWMWSNVPMASWMHTRSKQQQLMGMDIQSPFSSIDFIINLLDELGDQKSMALANECYATLNSFRQNIRRYGDAVYANKVPSQASAVQKVVETLSEIYADVEDSKTFELLHNAHVVAASEEYHRQRIFPGQSAAWNTRTKAFMDCILRSRDNISRVKQRDSNHESTSVKLIVWAHNSHVGDMRSTGYASQGQVSLGQLCREMFGKEGVFLIGMTTYEGTVRAAHADRQGACWKGKGDVMVLKNGLEDSHEAHLHGIATKMKQESNEAAFGLNLKGTDQDIAASFDCSRLERFVGSCYLPQMELMSHYSHCNLANQFDYVFHVDKSSAITV